MTMKNTLKKLIPYAFVGVISGGTTFGAIHYFGSNNSNSDFSYFAPKNSDAKYASFNMTGVGEDFVKASKTTVPAVVSIKNYSNRTQGRSEQDMFDLFLEIRLAGNQNSSNSNRLKICLREWVLG